MTMNGRIVSKTTTWLLAMALMLLGACNTQNKEPKPETDDDPMKEIDAPKEIISLDDADSLYVNYTRRRVEGIIKMETTDDSSPFKPVRFVAFDLETIKNYIAYVEQEAKKGGTKADSLRVYLGNYGSKVEGSNSRHNTVFMLPSAKAEDSYGGIYIGDNGQAKLIRNYFQNNGGSDNGQTKSKASLMPHFNSSLMQGGSLILNYGNCCPPKNGDF
jgi:hypothetical protein